MAKITVATKNMNTGHGQKDLRDRISEREMRHNITRVAEESQKLEMIEGIRTDILCFQEVDFRFPGTRLNQEYLLQEALGFEYEHTHRTAHHRSPFGQLLRDGIIENSIFRDSVVVNRDIGTCTLSRLPIVARGEYTFGQSYRQSPIENYFAKLLNESKGYTYIEVEHEGKRIGIFNVHLLNDIVYQIFNKLGAKVRGRTFSRAWQIEKLLEKIQEKRAEGVLVIVAGDFNSIPRELGKFNFKGSKNGDPDNYTYDFTIYRMREKNRLGSNGIVYTIPELFGEGTPDSIRPYYTYPAIDPDRPLDYIFASREFRFVIYRVLDSVSSDHRTVVAELEF